MSVEDLVEQFDRRARELSEGILESSQTSDYLTRESRKIYNELTEFSKTAIPEYRRIAERKWDE